LYIDLEIVRESADLSTTKMGPDHVAAPLPTVFNHLETLASFQFRPLSSEVPL